MSDVIVIGAGWGGLTAAAILAHNGLEVQVLESTGHIGGRSSFDRKDGFLVDYGIHILGYGSTGPAAKALREIGHEIEFNSYGEPQIFVDGKFTRMPTGVGSFLGSDYISWSDKMIIGHGVRRLLVSKTAKIADVPVVEFIPGSSRATVREFYEILCMLGLVAPYTDVTSAGELAKFLRRAMKAKQQLAYPTGGTSQINEALESAIKESGEILFNSRVKSMEIKGGRLESVKVHEDAFEARAYVFAVPAQRLPEIAGKGLDPEYEKKCASLVPASGISIDLCLNRKISDFDSFFITPEPMVLGQFTSNIDPTTAPEGKQLATFFRPLPYDAMESRERMEAEQDAFEAKIEEVFPGIMDAIEWERVLRMKMVDGFEPRVGQTAKDRPGIEVPGIENLFLAGDTAGVEGKSGDVAFRSGAEAAHRVMAYLK